MFPAIYGILSQLGLNFLLRDDFTTPEAAPIASPRTAEPGPGALTILDTGNNLSIAGGALISAGVVSTGNPNVAGASLPRSSGCSILAQLNSSSASNRAFVGFDSGAPGGSPNESSVYFKAPGSIRMFYPTELDVGSFVAATDYSIVHTLRSAGDFSFVRGGVFAEWTLLYVGNSKAVSPLTPYITFASGAIGTSTFDTLRVAQISAPFNTDNGIATDVHAGNVTTGTTFTHEADCLIEWTQTTVQSSGETVIVFRTQSATQYWYIQISAAGTVELNERDDAAFFNRAVAFGAVSSGDRLVIVADDETITVYNSNAILFAYSSAVNFKTATDGQVSIAADGAIADLISWPRVLSGAAKEALDEMAA